MTAIAAVLLCAAALILLYAVYVPKKYAEPIERFAEMNGLENEFVFAVVRAESNFRADAVSPAGAVGLMQLMPSTARFIAEISKTDIADLAEAEENIETGCRYLKYLQDRFMNMETVLAAYNAGEGRVRVWLSDENYSTDGITLRYIPFEETRRYVQKVKKFYKCYKLLYF